MAFTYSSPSLGRFFGGLFSLPTAWARTATATTPSTAWKAPLPTRMMTQTFRAAFGTTASKYANAKTGKLDKGGFGAASANKKRKTPRKGQGRAPVLTESGRKARTLRMGLFAPPPPPLRMARNRYLRHWTIHRAWQLFRRQQNEAIHKERSRMYVGMYHACEALRQTRGPGEHTEGYLYRVAMEKKGVWHGDAIPIEYARMQTETPATVAWNHDWKR